MELDATERLRILHDFYRQGEESEFVFNAREMMKRGHSFKDYICPDGIEKNSDYLKLGGKFCGCCSSKTTPLILRITW